MHFVFVSLSGLWIKQCKKWLWQYLISTSFLLDSWLQAENWTRCCFKKSRLRFKRIKWNEKITNHVRHPFNARQSSLCIFFLLFAKLGGWNCKVSRISWLPSKLIGLLQVYTLYWREGITARVRRSWSPKLLALVTSTRVYFSQQRPKMKGILPF